MHVQEFSNIEDDDPTGVIQLQRNLHRTLKKRNTRATSAKGKREKTMRALALLPLLSLLLLLSSSTSVNAVDPACTNMHAFASPPMACTNTANYGLSSFDLGSFFISWALLVDKNNPCLDEQCPLCNTDNPLMVENAAINQRDFTRIGQFCAQYNCWNGPISATPTSNSMIMPSLPDYASAVYCVSCNISSIPGATPPCECSNVFHLTQTWWIVICVGAFLVGITATCLFFNCKHRCKCCTSSSSQEISIPMAQSTASYQPLGDSSSK